MKNLSLLIVLICSANVYSKECSINDINLFANEFAVAYQTESLKDLDSKYCIHAMHATVEHSIAGEIEENGQTGEVDIHSFAELSGWLQSRRDENRPYPAIWPFEGCSSGICSFGGNTANQMHGHLFLKQIHYSNIQNKISISKILFEDGD